MINFLLNNDEWTFTDIPDFVQIANAATVFQTTNGIYWLTPYLSSEWPEVTCNKKWFFLYSTDHAFPQDGKIMWGQSNFLPHENGFLADWEYLGVIRGGLQDETPWLIRVSGHPEPLHLYYHTNQADPRNPGSQQRTHLQTTTGGLLHENIWTDVDNPLGFETGDTHTGYLKAYDFGSGYVATHYKFEFLPRGYQRSILNPNNVSWTRDGAKYTDRGQLDTTEYWTGTQYWVWANHFLFERHGIKWAIILQDDENRPSAPPFWRIALVKVSEDFRVTEFCTWLDGGNLNNGIDCFIEPNGDRIHIYGKDIHREFQENLMYSFFDLRNLELFI